MMDISSARKYSSSTDHQRSSAESSTKSSLQPPNSPLFPPRSPNTNNANSSKSNNSSARQSPRIPPAEPTIRSLAAQSRSSAEEGYLPPPLPPVVHHNRSSDSISSTHSNPQTSPRRLCAKCGLPMADKFVRAMGKKFHLDCFRCHECNTTVANKFFPVDDPVTGTEYALCETDYFRRLDLLCASCGTALRGSYVTALDKKYHVEHFTCSLCDTVFGPQDSYYEHDGQVYCHFHYSTKFAVRCHGCRRAILKQFVEIQRNEVIQHWHPECYMIQKYWNVKLASRSSKSAQPAMDVSNAATAREAELALEAKIHRIWALLSAFEESSAACISDMLLHVSNGNYMEGSQMASKFIVHVEVLFGAIDRLDGLNCKATGQGLQYQKEAKLLCRKIVNFFSLLSRTYEVGKQRLGITQELLSLVTGLAHYLKILIRLALTASLRLEQDHNDATALNIFLDTLSNLPTSDPPPPLSPSITPTSDLCFECSSTIEEPCLRFATKELDRRWHPKCLKCNLCKRVLGVDQALWSETKQKVICGSCAGNKNTMKEFPDAKPGFQKVSLLMQFIFLLRVALARLESILRERQSIPPDDVAVIYVTEAESNDQPEQQTGPLAVRAKSLMGDSSFSKTLDGVRRMRSSHLDQQLLNSAQKARQSRIIDGPEADSAFQDHSSPEDRYLTASDPSSRRPSTSPSDRKVHIVDDPPPSLAVPRALEDARALTLDDLPKLLAVEKAKEGRSGHHPSRQPSTNSYEFNFMAPDPIEEFTVSLGGGEPTPNNNDIVPGGNVKYFSELSALEYFIVRHIAVLALQTIFAEHFTLDELLELIETRKGTIWEKFGKAFRGSEKKNVKKKGVFGVAIDVLAERNGSDSVMGSGPGSLRIPAFVDDVITTMRQMDMSVEGVFRKNGNIRRLKEIAEAFDKQAQPPSLDEENPVQLAALLKKFLRDLPDPLLTGKLQKLWVASQKLPDTQSRVRALHLTCCLLPKVNRDTMEVVFSFLYWVASFYVDDEVGSKMDLHNIATVITPNVLYAKGRDGSPIIDDSFSSIEVVQTLIDRTQEFCQVPADLVEILADPTLFASSAELTTKDILKRCAGFFRNPPRQPVHQDTVRSLNGPQERRTVIRVDTGLAQKEAGHSESVAQTKVGPQTPVSGGSNRSGQGWGSTESSPRGQAPS